MAVESRKWWMFNSLELQVRAQSQPEESLKVEEIATRGEVYSFIGDSAGQPQAEMKSQQ